MCWKINTARCQRETHGSAAGSAGWDLGPGDAIWGAEGLGLGQFGDFGTGLWDLGPELWDLGGWDFGFGGLGFRAKALGPGLQDLRFGIWG